MTAIVLGAASPALACTCPNGPDGVVRYPEDGAADIAADTPIVVQLTDHVGDPGEIGISLEDEAANEIALNENERVPPSWKGCGAAESVFLRPASRLERGAKYTVWFSAGSMRQRGATFTVGDHSFDPDPEIAASVRYAAHYLKRACLDDDCPALANIQVDLDAPPDRLAWLFIESNADIAAKNHWPLRPGDADRKLALTVMQGADDRCVDVRILGVEGRALFEERVCEPSECALCTIVALSTCGAPSSCSTMVSCEDAGETRVVSETDGGASHDAEPRERASRRRESGCSAFPAGQRDSRALAALTLQLVAAAFSVRAVRRRRGG